MGPGTADGAARHASVAVDGALGDALDITDPQALAELVAALESVLGHLCEGRASER